MYFWNLGQNWGGEREKEGRGKLCKGGGRDGRNKTTTKRKMRLKIGDGVDIKLPSPLT